MGRVGDNAQLRLLLQRRRPHYIERVARNRLERPDPPLAENHRLGSGRQRMLGRAGPLLHRRRHAPLQQHRHSAGPRLLQQRKVLHGTGSDLDHCNVPGGKLHIARIDHLAYKLQSVVARNLRSHQHTVLARPLIIVRRRARFVGSGPHIAQTFRRNAGKNRGHLFLGLDPARPGDNRKPLHARVVITGRLRPLHQPVLASGAHHRLHPRRVGKAVKIDHVGRIVDQQKVARTGGHAGQSCGAAGHQVASHRLDLQRGGIGRKKNRFLGHYRYSAPRRA